MPRTFGGRLTVAFVAVIALTLSLVSLLVLNRLDAYFVQQQRADLQERAETVNFFIQRLADGAAGRAPVVGADGLVDDDVLEVLTTPTGQAFITDRLGQADVIARFGIMVTTGDRTMFVPATNGTFQMYLQAPPRDGQSREATFWTERYGGGGTFQRYMLEITLANPSTFRASAIATLTGLLAAIALFALGLAVVVSAALTRRFTTPLRQLTDASRALAEGDLSRRVPANQLRAGSTELGELAVQFNTMADRLEESVEIIRRDRDRSRDFLADVSHELRTPLAALRTFNQLLMETAGDDPAARAEFLESSAGQIERLDWLAQNLLELSKLDSRPRPARSAARRPTRGGRIGGPSARLRCRPSRRSRHDRASRHSHPHPPRPAAHRPGRREPRRQRDQIHAARRLGAGCRGGDRRRCPDRRYRHGRRHRPGRAAPHLRTVLSWIARE